MKQPLVATVLLALASAGTAQTPDLALRWDIRGTYIARSGNNTKLRWYDPMGRPSTVGFGLTLEPGYYVLITQRLQRVERDIDREQIDEAYIEDPGNWRLGRQYLPVGAKGLIREAALGARGDFRLARDLDAQVVVFDNGRRALRGGVIRIGKRSAVTIGVGRHFSAAATSLGAIRAPEDNPGRGRGYRFLIAADSSINWGTALVTAELVGLRDGQTPLDRSEAISDVRIANEFAERKVEVVLAWSRKWKERRDIFRMESALKISKNVSVTSFVRFDGGTWKDLGAGIRVRL